MKKIICAAVISAVLSGCVHNEPNPTIQEYRMGDNEASCEILHANKTNAERQRDEAHSAHNWQIGTNIFDGVAGAFLLVPWFFIDTGNGHEIDERNASARIANMDILLAQKHCDAPVVAPTGGMVGPVAAGGHS